MSTPVLGIVGVAPWSTLDFCRALYGQVPAKKDWEYPRVLLDVNTKIPSRGRHFELGEADFSPAIAASIRGLAQLGASVAVVTCNTAHIYFDRWAPGSPIPIVHLGRECVAAVRRAQARKVAVMGGNSLRLLRYYEDLLMEAGMETVDLSDSEAALIAAAIAEVKLTSTIGAELRGRLARLMDDLTGRGADGLILGCTELSSLLPMAGAAFPCVVESNRESAAAALRWLAG